jgi:sarcosine oxidase subunit alpha
VFENNERPGIMQVNCAHRLANIYGIKPGRRGVLAVGHDLGLEAALDLSQIGVQVMAVADARGHGADQGLVQALSDKGIAYLAGWVATKAHGGKKVEKVSLASLNGPGKRQLDCDLLVTSAGLTPNAGPLYTAGAKMAYDHHVGAFLPVELPPELFVAGRVVGYTTPNAVEASGRLAGFKAASAAGAGAASQIAQSEAALEASGGRVQGSQVVTSPHIGKGSKAFVCFDEDTTVKHVNQSVEVGMDVPELAKRYTAAGTGPSQGGVPGHNLPLVINQFRQSGPAEVLPTTVRPPLVPAQFATYAGFNHDIYKRTPMHETQEKAGAIFRRVGVWKRARYFSDDHSAKEEIQNVRNNVGLIDVSTLGKFRIFGPDALKALERVYVGHMAKVKEGKLKYTAMVNDDGNLIDDGVVTKVGENDYYLTTSTGRAGQTIEWIRFHTRYDGWDFHMVNLTDTLGAINLAGPKAREVLSKLTDDDVSPEGFPFMGYREITLMDRVPARVLRVGFVGELSYEIHLPASWAQTVWDRLMEAGAEFGIKPFGLEAQSVLRLEKGHVIIGTESEIRTSLHDLGLGFLWYRDKPEAKTVGAPALRITENQDGRLKLVGIQLDNAMTKVADGALVVDERMRGHAPSIRYSHALEQTVGLALVEDELAALGTKLTLYDSGQPAQRPTATVVKPPFYDPEGHRLKM